MPNRRERRRRPKVRAEWRRRADFAEYAEAVDVPTDLVMAVSGPDKPETLVLFTREPDTTLIYAATVRRGVDGVLFVLGEPEPKPGMWEEIVRRMEEEP